MRMSTLLNEVRNFELDEGFSPKEIKMAIGIASDPRYAKGNMTGAVNAIEKMKKGLSKHPQVAAVLKRQNENLDEAKFSNDMIDKLKKTYEPLKGKKVNPTPLMKIFDKIDSNKDGLEQLYKADIPFVSMMAMSRLMLKHNYKAADINKLGKIRREDFVLDEAINEMVMKYVLINMQNKVQGYASDKKDALDIAKRTKSTMHPIKKKITDKTLEKMNALAKTPKELQDLGIIDEAVSPAQQAAIAISKKERGEKPKKEGNTFGKELKAARDKGEKTFVVGGKTYNVEDYDIKEDGHTDVASAVRQCKTMIEDAMQISSKLQSMNPEDSLPSWWTNKLAISSNSMNKLRDYFLVPSNVTEELQEAMGDLEDMKKIVAELEKASKMHLGQSKRIAAHIGMMSKNEETELDEQKVGGYNVDNDVVIRKGNKYHKTVDNLFKSKSDAQKFAKEFDGFVIPQSGGRFIVGLNKVTEEVELDEAMYHHVLKNKVVASGSKSDMMKLVKKNGATIRKGPDTNYVLNSPGAKVGDVKEVNEKFTKKDFKDNEASNHHTENGVEIVNMFGTSAEKVKMAGIAARHNMKGISRKDQQDRDALVKKYYSKLESVNEMAYKPGSFKDTKPQEKGAKALADLAKTGGMDKKDFEKARALYVQASDPASREKLKKFIFNLDTEPKEEIMDKIGRNDPETFLKMYPNAKAGEPLTRVSFAHRSMKSEELEEKYDLYHKDFSSAMQHAYDYAKKKMGITVDPKEIDNKVATGPKKPSEGKTNTYKLKGKGGNLQIQVYNKGGSKPFELNMYKEEFELIEQVSNIRMGYQTLTEKVDPADVDDTATDKDIENAGKNIIMQLRKSVSMRGNKDVEFADGKKKVDMRIAQKAIDMHMKMRTSDDKLKFQNSIAKSYKDLLNTVKGK